MLRLCTISVVYTELHCGVRLYHMVNFESRPSNVSIRLPHYVLFQAVGNGDKASTTTHHSDR